MPSFTKFCSRLLRLRRRTNTSKIATNPPPSLATTLPDKNPSIVSDAETERMTEIIEDSPESDYQHASNHCETSSGRVYPQAEHFDNNSQVHGRFKNNVCRSHGLLTPHPSTGNAHAEEFESEDTIVLVKRKFEEAIAHAEEQPSRSRDIPSRFLSTSGCSPSKADTYNLYASVGVQTSLSYTSSRPSSSSSRPTRFPPPSLSTSNPATPVRSHNYTNSGARTQPLAGPSKRTHNRSRTLSPSPSPATRAAHRLRDAQAPPQDVSHTSGRKRSFIIEGEREQQAVLDDLRYLRSERDRLYTELRRIFQLEKDHISFFWSPGAPVDLEENDGAQPEDAAREPESGDAVQSRNGSVDTNADVETGSLDYVTLTSEEERRVHSQHVLRLTTLIQNTEDLAKRSESVLGAVIHLEPQPATENSAESQFPSHAADDAPFPPSSVRNASGGNHLNNATPLRQERRSPYRNTGTAPAFLYLTPTRSLGRSSLQASASTPTSNGLGPGFTYGEGTVSDQASLSFSHGRSALSMHSLEDELGPPPVRDPDSYFIWLDLEVNPDVFTRLHVCVFKHNNLSAFFASQCGYLSILPLLSVQTNDAVRPASHTRILEVAVCVTDRNFTRLDKGVSYLVHWPFDAEYIASEMPEKCVSLANLLFLVISHINNVPGSEQCTKMYATYIHRGSDH